MILKKIASRLMGWECVGTEIELKTRVDPNILKILEKKSAKTFERLKKDVYSGSVKSYDVYVKGSTYIYKALVPSSMWIDNQGHGGFIQNGPMVIYRKKRKK